MGGRCRGHRADLDMLNFRYDIDISGISQRRINYEVEIGYHMRKLFRSTQ